MEDVLKLIAEVGCHHRKFRNGLFHISDNQTNDGWRSWLQMQINAQVVRH